MLDSFGADSLVIGRLLAVEGRRGVAMLDCFRADSFVIGRLSAVEGRSGVALLTCFNADSLVTGRLSEVEGRHGLVTSVGFLEASLVIGCRFLVQGRCDAAEEGLLKPVLPLLPVVSTKSQLTSLGLCNDRIFSLLAIWFITLVLPEPGPLLTIV
uniref:Uncharacterized protein n=1 Tax=Arundo donax TaxID=35708 RepID=A0A0A9CSU3_ARUDO